MVEHRDIYCPTPPENPDELTVLDYRVPEFGVRIVRRGTDGPD
jgi:hypothetical protein